jgi:hypothetical protein
MAKHQGGIGMADDPDKDGRITFKTVITWVLTVGTVGVGIWQFAIQHAQSNRVPFLEVEAAMVTFGKLIPQGSVPDLPLQALQRPSLELAHTVRDLILASWNVDLPPLQGRTP